LNKSFKNNFIQFISITGSLVAILSLFVSQTLLQYIFILATLTWLSYLNKNRIQKTFENLNYHTKIIFNGILKYFSNKPVIYLIVLFVLIGSFVVILIVNLDNPNGIEEQNKDKKMMKTLSSFAPYKKCDEKDFINYLRELKNYLVAREKYANLNPEKIINLMNLHYQSLLLYKSNSTKKFIITLNGSNYEMKIEGHDGEGRKKIVDLVDISNQLIKDLSKIIINHVDPKYQKELFAIFSRALITPSINSDHKFEILNLEQNDFKNHFKSNIFNVSENEAIESLQIRRNFIYDNIKNPDSVLRDETAYTENVDNLYKIFEYYTQRIIDVFLYHNKQLNIFELLISDLENNSDSKINYLTLLNLIKWNNLFFFEKKENIDELIQGNSKSIGKERIKELREGMEFNPTNIELSNLSIALQDYDFSNVSLKNIKTVISFVIPYATKEEYKKISRENCEVEFLKMKSLFDDPIFQFLRELDISFNNTYPLTVLSDAVGNTNESTLVNVILSEFYHPDFEISEGKLVVKDFSEKEALMGRKYYPHKDTVVYILRNLKKSVGFDFPIEITQEDIDINLISNYFVNNIDQTGKSVYHKLYTITNLDSYLSIKKRYLNQISKLNLNDDYTKIKELLYDTDIVNSNVFRAFLTKLLNLVVKKSIEKREIYKFLWDSDEYDLPKSEKQIQPIIKSHLQPIVEIKGIQISREIVSANGSLDYHCSYNIDNNLNKVCIELKLAHNEQLLNGISKQLPAYMEDEGTRDGLFIVLWFKNENFDKPSKYQNKEQLLIELQNSIPKNLRIDVIIIDCSQPIVPSKL
jgi:hypothetical protein